MGTTFSLMLGRGLSRGRIRLCTRLVLLLLIAVAAPGVQAASAMLELLEVLHANGTIDEQAYASLREAVKTEAERGVCPPAQGGVPVSGTAKDVVAAAAAQSHHANTEKAAGEDGVTVEVGGRLQLDAASYHTTGNVDFGNGAEVRRARLRARGKVAKDWGYQVSVELTDDVELRTSYLDYRGWENQRLMFGKFKEPMVLEELNSSKYTTFMERAMLTDLHPGRKVGMGWHYRGDRWLGQAGIFADDVDSEETADDAVALTGRFIVTPVRNDSGVLHLAGSVSYRDLPRGTELRFRSRPESHVTDVRLIDTGTIAPLSRQWYLGAEVAWTEGPISLQGEYLRTELDRDNAASLAFQGWYAYASWFLSGDSRPYRRVRGTFGRVRPQRPLGAGGWGAWELAARFSHLDLTDGEVTGGEQDNLTLGVNWHPTDRTRFMFNYVKVLELDRPGTAQDGVEPDILQVRTQVEF